jgi:plastocyanin
MKRSTLLLRAGVLLLALLLALMLTACGSDDDGDDTGAGDQTEQTTDTGQSGEPTDAPPGGAGGQIAVTAQEFEFSGIPDTVPAGETTFNFTNAGKQPHEFFILKLTEDAPPLEKLLEMGEKEGDAFVEDDDIGQAFAKPGKTEEGAFTADLAAGTYAYVCFVQDPKSKTPHAFLGMNGTFTVQ